MDALTVSDELELGPLLGRSMKQSGEPNQRDRDTASVDKVHDQLVVGDADLGREGFDVGR